MDDKSRDLLAQLSGLRLSDGSVVGNRLSTGSTPPALSVFSSRSTPTQASPSSFPTSAILNPQHSDPLNGTHGQRQPQLRAGRAQRAGTPKEFDSTPPSVAEKLNRLLAQNRGAVKSSPTPETFTASSRDDGRSILAAIAARSSHSSSPSSSNGAAAKMVLSTPPDVSASPTLATATAAAGAKAAVTRPSHSGITVPKPRSVEISTVVPTANTVVVANPSAAEPLNPKVMEFFTKTAGTSWLPPPLVESAAVIKGTDAGEGAKNNKPAGTRKEKTTTVTTTSAITAHAASTTAAASSSNVTAGAASHPASSNAAGPAARPSHAPPSSSAKPQRPAHDPANKFLVDAFGHLDNVDAAKPIIRTAPAIPSEGRYIVVGDVHGCVDQLEQLMEKVRYVKNKDCLLIIGDYVNKGPDSVGVVRACQRLGAYGVLGNHDFTLLRCCARMRRRAFTPDDLRDPVKRLAQKFPADCEHYLRSLPHMVRIPRHNVLLVHAGLNIQHPVEQQNVEEVMHLRRLEAVPNKPGTYKAIAKGMEGVAWGQLWEGPEYVVFGHDAFSGFQSHSHCVGIDTGCVYGDPLTCVVFSQETPTGEFFSVGGLPRLENEMKGLPPPTADIYEQDDMDLQRLIIRPTSRATPVTVNSSLSTRPVFLAAPLGYTGGEDGAVGLASTVSSIKASNLTATVTSTNTLVTPTSMSPIRLATPTCAANLQMMETTDANTREVQRSTLLALSATHELTAIAVLLAMPLYAQEMDVMLRAEAADEVSQGAFWEPFARYILTAATELSTRSTSPMIGAEPALQLALDICEEMEALGDKLQPELKSYLQAAKDHPIWPKHIIKCVETLIH